MFAIPAALVRDFRSVSIVVAPGLVQRDIGGLTRIRILSDLSILQDGGSSKMAAGHEGCFQSDTHSGESARLTHPLGGLSAVIGADGGSSSSGCCLGVLRLPVCLYLPVSACLPACLFVPSPACLAEIS